MSDRDQQMNADAVKFLELLLSECDGKGDHAWRKCRRCLAYAELEGQQPLARGFLQQALQALRGVSGRRSENDQEKTFARPDQPQLRACESDPRGDDRGGS